jgi:hypothetical protein
MHFSVSAHNACTRLSFLCTITNFQLQIFIYTDLYGLTLSIIVGFKYWLHIFKGIYFLTYDLYFTVFHEITVVGTSMSEMFVHSKYTTVMCGLISFPSWHYLLWLHRIDHWHYEFNKDYAIISVALVQAAYVWAFMFSNAIILQDIISCIYWCTQMCL